MKLHSVIFTLELPPTESTPFFNTSRSLLSRLHSHTLTASISHEFRDSLCVEMDID